MYRTFFIPKKNGKLRKIMEPAPDLKEVQYVLKSKLDQVPLHTAAHGFVAGKGIVSNALVHRKSRYVLNIDIKDFFPSVKFEQYPFCQIEQHLTDEEVQWVKEVCFWNGSLPQGAPTSPVLANIKLKEVDETITAWCLERGLLYTRYADDMTFSCKDDYLKEFLTEFIENIDVVLGSIGLRRNTKKTKLMPYYQRQLVTGVVVNNERLTLARTIKEQLFQELKGLSRAALTVEQQGYLEYVNQVDSKTYNKLCQIMI